MNINQHYHDTYVYTLHLTPVLSQQLTHVRIDVHDDDDNDNNDNNDNDNA